jgi:protein phosphatase
VLASFGLSDVGCVRRNNEDSYLVDPALGLYVVADGMGGAQAGEVASRLAVEGLRAYLQSSPFRDEHALVEAAEHANRLILDAAATPGHQGMGTTLVAVLELGSQCAIANVGDSRAWMLRQGELSQLTADQSWVNEVGRPMGLSEENLRAHPMRHVLTMALGVGQNLRVGVQTMDLTPGSALLLCSDGLHGPVSPEEIRQVLLREISLEARAHLLVEAAKRAGGPDNVTVVLMES